MFSRCTLSDPGVARFKWSNFFAGKYPLDERRMTANTLKWEWDEKIITFPRLIQDMWRTGFLGWFLTGKLS